MSTITRFTKEQLIKRLEEQRSSARYALSFVQDSEILRDIEMDLRITEIALASLEADSDSSIHPAHGPLSNYRLHRIREILSKAAAQRDGGNIGYAMSDAVKAIDELLAGRKAEPVADVVAWASPNEERTCDIRWRRFDVAPGPLYTAPPAPVVPDCVERKDFEVWARSAGFNEDWYFFTNTHPNHYDDDHVNDMWAAWNACRAAMLNGGKS